MSMSCGMKLARCLAQETSTSWDRVNMMLYSKCPHPPDNGFYNLSSRNQEAVLALGIYYLESKFKHEDKILDYLLSLVRGLGSALFPDELPLDRSSKLPPAEIFSFSLVTLLNDVASHHPNSDQVTRILESQVELMNNILAKLVDMKRQDKPSPFNTRKATCKSVVPVLLGLARAMARFSTQDFLISKIYPNSKIPTIPAVSTSAASTGETNPEIKMKGYTNFRYKTLNI